MRVQISEKFSQFLRSVLMRYGSWSTVAEIILVSTAVFIGIGTGVLAALLIRALEGVTAVASWAQNNIQSPFGLLLGLVVAGLLVGFVVERWVPDAGGHGVPEVIKAVALHGGYMSGWLSPIKLGLSAVTIGMGGAAGREGPIVQIGAAFGSWLGRLTGFTGDRLRILVACGSAAGISAVFNAPIAGAMFALEVVLHRFTVGNFGAVVLSAISGSIIVRQLISRVPAFPVPAYRFSSLGELPIYMVLALLAALWAVLFIRVFAWSEQTFSRWRIPLPIKAAIGMFLTGLIALWGPGFHILGSGLEFIGETITDNFTLPWATMAALLVLKMLGTTLTLGSGNSGGVFAPNLFMGAVLGGLIGSIAHTFWPGIATNPGAYALVGMAAMLGAAEHAPITAVLLVFEMSGDYQLIVPLLLTTVLASLVSEALSSGSIYTTELGIEGIRLHRGRDEIVLDSILVKEVMSIKMDYALPEMTLEEFSRRLRLTHHHGLPIIDKGILKGIATIADLERAGQENLPASTPVLEIATPRDKLVVITPEKTIAEAMRLMSQYALGRIPVVSVLNPDQFLGMVRRADVITAYEIALTRRSESKKQVPETDPRHTSSAVFVEIPVHAHDSVCNKHVRELAATLPQDCILVAIRRDGRLLIPHGDSALEANDLVTVLVAEHDRGALINCFGTPV